MAPKKSPCGTYTRYTHGCKCEPCKEAGRKWRQDRKNDPERSAKYAAAQKRHRKKYRDKYRSYNADRKEQIRLVIKELKESTPCVDCKIKYPYYVMDFDHLPGSDKKNTVAKMLADANSVETLMIEIEKCELVCSNCHRIRTHKRKG